MTPDEGSEFREIILTPPLTHPENVDKDPAPALTDAALKRLRDWELNQIAKERAIRLEMSGKSIDELIEEFKL